MKIKRSVEAFIKALFSTDLSSSLKSTDCAALNPRERMKELEALSNEGTRLKESLPILTKKGWRKKATTKLYKWASKEKNRKMLSDVVSIGKGLIEAGKMLVS